MGKEIIELVAFKDLPGHINARVEEGWLVRSVNIKIESCGNPMEWAPPEEWFYWVRLQRMKSD